ncbi:MAG: coiled coil domain-containing protein [Acidobacteria bacterium]|nr:coiled coil domain-containing protein [Acidobacteriota bacterium]MBI3487209.1 coiled coil domain-containing protein [Acidobacteriota bacterium]
MLENRKVYEGHLEAQLAQWKAEIEVIRAKASRAEVSAKVQYDQSIEKLQRIHDDAEHQLCVLRDSADEAWESLKLSTEKAWTRFRSHFPKPATRT